MIKRKLKPKAFDFANSIKITYSQAVKKVRITYWQEQETQLAFYDASRTVWEKEEVFLADDTTT